MHARADGERKPAGVRDLATASNWTIASSIDIAGAPRQIASVGPHCSRPAYPRHIAQALQFARAPGGGLWAICLISTSLSFGRGIPIRAFDDRPVSCRVQPSVVSLPKEMRNVLRQRDLPQPC